MKIMRLSEVIDRTGLGRSSIYKLMAEGQFPKNINLSSRSVGWVEQEVLDWINKRIEQRSTLMGI